MFEFFTHLLGRTSDRRSGSDPNPASQLRQSAATQYFHLLTRLDKTKRAGDWESAAEVARALIRILPDFVRDSVAEYGDIPPNLPVFTDGARALVMMDDEAGLKNLLRLTSDIAELDGWLPVVQEALGDRGTVEEIRRVLHAHPGKLQKDMKKAIGAEDGRRVSSLLYHLDKGGLVQRIRYKNTYVLGLPGVDIALPDDHAALTSQPMNHAESKGELATTFDEAHERRSELKSRQIDLASLEYVPLPRAPLRWEERKKPRTVAKASAEYFELAGGSPWQLGSAEKLPMEERPETAYRRLAPHAMGSFMIDDLGKIERFPTAPLALLASDRSGRIVAEAPLAWGAYRWEVNPTGTGFIAMDKRGVVHAYDATLHRILATPLLKAPEIAGLMARYDFSADDLKNHTRTVALSPAGDLYLFTVVDRIYVIDTSGSPQWSLQLPKQDGWTQVAHVSGHSGTSEQFYRALEVLELGMPVSLDDVRRNYRRLAKLWHPDVNQGSTDAEERFKELNNAAELLSGLDVSSLAPEVDHAVYRRSLQETSWTVEGVEFSVQLGIQGSEKQASDWIYASAFAADGGVFLAGYSGRVVRMNRAGQPVRAYDIGVVPRRIADTGDYLYILTDTRLYILDDRSLVRLMDVFDEGELIIGQTGFGLLERKRFRWFTETGDPVGAVLTKNPIRRVHSTHEGLVIETRQRRVRVAGAPVWWEE